MRWASAAGDVQLRLVPLPSSLAAGDGDATTAAEHAHAGRFRHAADRLRFLAGRATLRRLLGEALGVAPAAVPLGPPGRGRPALRDGGAWSFSVAHAGEWIAVVLARGADVGVDLEPVRLLPDVDALAAAALAPEELTSWRGVAGPDRAREFLSYWVCKEAVLKAVGVGLTTGPATVPIRLQPHPAVADSPDGRWRATDWRLVSLIPDAAHVGAVAIRPTAMP